MATARLRQTFRYPDPDSDNENEGMDEQDQETLLTTLATQDSRMTSIYTKALLTLPLLPLLFYLPLLLRPSSFLPGVLGIVSLLGTAYMLFYMPLPPTSADTGLLASQTRTSSKGKSILRDTSGHRAPASPAGPASPLHKFMTEEHVGLLHQYLVLANSALCLSLAMYEVFRGLGWKSGTQIGGGYVPGFVFAVILVARRELRVVDLGELERLRYRHKGV